MRQAFEAATAKAAQKQVDLDNMYGPITELGKFSNFLMLAMTRLFVLKKLMTSSQPSVVDRYSAMVVPIELVRCYQNPANEAILHIHSLSFKTCAS